MANKRTSLNDREKQTRPVDVFFTPSKTSQQNENIINNKLNNETSNIVNNKTSNPINIEKEEYIRQTYYLTQDLINEISVYSTFEDMDKSEIVRKAIEKFIPKKYKEMAKQIKK